jgi:glycine hydroxymethyltransferase
MGGSKKRCFLFPLQEVVSKTTKKKNSRESYDKIFTLLKEHQAWFDNSLPLIASENVASPAVREAMVSDMANRYAEGWPGERVYAGCVYIDQVELECIDLAKAVFGAEFADVRPISGVNANLALYSAFTNPGDTMVALPVPSGGHISHGRKDFSGTAGLVHGLRVEFFGFSKDDMNIDVDKTKERVEELEREEGIKPKFVMFGGSLFLFPHPVKELSEYFRSRVKNENDVFICYDGAHVSGLIAGGQFQRPLQEGADAMSMSTHKTLFGPPGGLIVAARNEMGDKIKPAVFPGTTSSHHLHNVAGKAVALAEMLEFGEAYAKQVVKNAKALAQALHSRGISVLGEKNGFTESHQVAFDVTKFGDGGTLEKELEKANIIVNRQLIPGDYKAGRHYMHPGGIRIGASEISRLGMKESDMEDVADLMCRVIVKRDSPAEVGKAVSEFRSGFQKVHYAFDTKTSAYEYIKVR